MGVGVGTSRQTCHVYDGASLTVEEVVCGETACGGDWA